MAQRVVYILPTYAPLSDMKISLDGPMIVTLNQAFGSALIATPWHGAKAAGGVAHGPEGGIWFSGREMVPAGPARQRLPRPTQERRRRQPHWVSVRRRLAVLPTPENTGLATPESRKDTVRAIGSGVHDNVLFLVEHSGHLAADYSCIRKSASAPRRGRCPFNDIAQPSTAAPIVAPQCLRNTRSSAVRSAGSAHYRRLDSAFSRTGRRVPGGLGAEVVGPVREGGRGGGLQVSARRPG